MSPVAAPAPAPIRSRERLEELARCEGQAGEDGKALLAAFERRYKHGRSCSRRNVNECRRCRDDLDRVVELVHRARAHGTVVSTAWAVTESAHIIN